MLVTSILVHKYAECEDIWVSLTSEEQDALLDFALRVWNDSEGMLVEVGLIDQFAVFGEKGILVQENDRWRFVFPQMLPFIQSIALIDTLSLLSKAANNLFQELVGLIYSARNESHKRFKEHNVALSFIIARLINAHRRIEILEFVISPECSNDSFWQFHNSICHVIPILNLSAEIFANIFKRVVIRTRNDFAGGQILPAAEYLGWFQPSVGIELIDRLSRIEDWENIEILERLMTGVAYSQPRHFEFIVTTCERWLNGDPERLCRAALGCARNLTLTGKLEHDWILSRVASLLSLSSKNIRMSLSFVLCCLGVGSQTHTEDYLGFLVQLKQIESEGEVAHGIASALAHNDNAPLAFRLSCLSLLTNVPHENKGTIKQIGWFLYPLIRSHPAEVWDYLKAWILAHNSKTMIVEHDMFLSTIQEISRSDPGAGQHVLTQWFASSDLRLVEEARSILRELDVFTFSSQDIVSMPSHIIEYITEKLLAGGFEGSHLLSLCYSILKHINDEELEPYFSKVLRYITLNYPSSAIEFFERVVDDKDKSLSSMLLQKARTELKKYQAQRKGMFIQELVPPKHRVERFCEFEAKRLQMAQAEIVNDEQQFPLMSLVSRVSIGRGDRSFHMNVFHLDPAQTRTFTAPQGFGMFSNSIELPRAEIIDPEGEAFLRLRRLNLTPDDLLKDE